MADEEFPAALTAVKEYEELERRMSDPAVASDPTAIRKLGRRHAELGVIVSAYRRYASTRDDLEAARELAGEDAEFAAEATRLEGELSKAEETSPTRVAATPLLSGKPAQLMTSSDPLPDAGSSPYESR